MVPLFEDQKLEQSRRFIYEGEGAALLKEALLDSRKYEKLFDPKTFVWMYNIIQMNCSAINPQSPWEVYASNIKKIRPVETLQVVVGHLMNLAQFFDQRYRLTEEERALTTFHLLSRFLYYTYSPLYSPSLGRSHRSAGNGLYVLHSCMNHSCDPNIEVRNEATNGTIHLIAMRPIAHDEELCIDYAGFSSAKWAQGRPTRTERQQHLHRTFGFLCLCPKCQSGA